MNKYILPISSVLAVSLSAIISVVPVGFYNQGEVSALYPTLFTPAPFTFSIWSIIYISWFILGIGTALGKIHISKENSYTLGLAQILSSLWLLPSQFLFIGTSLCAVLSLLYLLILNFFMSRNEHSFFKNVLDLFLGWIIIATIANIHITLVAYNIYFFPVLLTLLSLVLGYIIVGVLLQKYNSFIPTLVYIWAAFGIFIGQGNNTIQVTALLFLSILTGILAIQQKDSIFKIISKLKK